MAFFFLVGTTIAFKLYSAYIPYGVRIVFTPSIPVGIYASQTYKGEVLQRGQGVCFKPVERLWMQGRDYAPKGETFCKLVLGVPGDVITPKGAELFQCSGDSCSSLGIVKESDVKGLPVIPAFPKAQAIGSNFYYLGATKHPRSFDSRYLGLIPSESITVKIWPIWLF